jgi:chaperone modulatory protein CbpM
MVTDAPDASWLDPHGRIDQGELATMCSLTVTEIEELVEYGSLTPVAGETVGVRQFSAACVMPLREAVRLRGIYDLDLFTVSLLLGLLQRIGHLEHQLRTLQAHLPHGQPPQREGPTPWREPHA